MQLQMQQKQLPLLLNLKALQQKLILVPQKPTPLRLRQNPLQRQQARLRLLQK